jgi:hypothetical protein
MASTTFAKSDFSSIPFFASGVPAHVLQRALEGFVDVSLTEASVP